MGAQLTFQVDDFLKSIQKDPNYVKNSKAALEKETQIPKAEREVIAADLDSFAVFAKNFHKDFPKGIRIAPDDILSIMGHFGSILVPPPSPAPREQPREPKTIA